MFNFIKLLSSQLPHYIRSLIQGNDILTKSVWIVTSSFPGSTHHRYYHHFSRSQTCGDYSEYLRRLISHETFLLKCLYAKQSFVLHLTLIHLSENFRCPCKPSDTFLGLVRRSFNFLPYAVPCPVKIAMTIRSTSHKPSLYFLFVRNGVFNCSEFYVCHSGS